MKNRLSKQISKFKKKKYIVSILFVLFLLFISLTGPGLLFDIQDHLQVRKTWQGLGNSLDIEFSGASSGNMNISAQKLECNLSGACSLTNDGDIAKCDIECSGASKFINNGNIEDGNVECSGASAVKLTGKGSRLDLEGSGACKINTRDFIASDVILELSGASTASVYAEKSLKYSVSRTSKLTYYGNAEPIDMYESGNVVKGN